MNYITTDIHSDKWDFAQSINIINRELKKYLPSTVLRNFYGANALGIPNNSLFKFINTIENLFFINNLTDSYNVYNLSIARNFNQFTNTIINVANQFKLPFVIAIAPKTKWKEIHNIKHLEVVEKELRENSYQFLKVFTYENVFAVYSNKQLTPEQLIKLKLLQWKIFEKNIETKDSNIIKFFTNLCENNIIEANKTINNIFKRPELLELKYQEIEEVFKYGYNKQTNSIKEYIETLQNRITDMENALADTITTLRDQNNLYEALKNKPNPETKSLIKFLIKHPYIQSIDRISTETLKLYFEAPIIYFDKYIIEQIKKNKSGTQKYILEIFETNEYELITRCNIYFNVNTFKIEINSIGDNDIIGHPHIDRYHCFGTHNRAIRESAKTQDYIGAIEQISQGVLNLNFADSIVINEMLNHLTNNKTRFRTWRHKETGVMCTTQEVIDQYKKEETNEETEALLF